jgi:hypothetical protein
MRIFTSCTHHILLGQLNRGGRERKGACGSYERDKGACETLVGNAEGKRPLERSRLRREDNFKMDLKELQWDDVDFIHLPRS